MLEPEWYVFSCYTRHITLVISPVILQMCASANHQYAFLIELIGKVILCCAYKQPYGCLADSPKHITGHRNLF